MKYIYIYFIVFAVANTYVSATENVLLSNSNTREVCNCKDLLNTILNRAITEQNRLINLNKEVTKVQNELKDLLNEVKGQGTDLNTIEKDFATILVLQQALQQGLSDQQTTYTSILKVLKEFGKETGGILSNSNQQTNIIENLLTNGWQTYECNYKDFCQAA